MANVLGNFFGSEGGSPVGGALGSLFGGGGSEQRRMKREFTKQGYAYVQQAYEFEAESREQIQEAYTTGIGNARARYAGSGGTFGDQGWRRIKGAIVTERNEALSALEEERREIEKTESYGWFKQDYERIGGVNVVTRGGKEDKTRTWSIYGEGRSGESYFTEAQRKSLRTASVSGDAGSMGMGGGPQNELFRQYSERLQPGLKEWEKARFGTKEDKREFRKAMDQRVAEANKWYDRQLKIQTAERERARKAQLARDNTRR